MALDDLAAKAASAAGKKAASAGAKGASKAAEGAGKTAGKAAEKAASKSTDAASKAASTAGKTVGAGADAADKGAKGLGSKFDALGKDKAPEKSIGDLAKGESAGKKSAEQAQKRADAKSADPNASDEKLDEASQSTAEKAKGKVAEAAQSAMGGGATNSLKKAKAAGKDFGRNLNSMGGVQGTENDFSEHESEGVAEAKKNIKDVANEAKNVGSEIAKGAASGAATGAMAGGVGAAPGAALGALKGLGRGVLKSKKLRKAAVILVLLGVLFSPAGIMAVGGMLTMNVITMDEAAQEGASEESSTASGVEGEVRQAAASVARAENIPREIMTAANHIQNGGEFHGAAGSGSTGEGSGGEGGSDFTGEFNEGFDTTECTRLGTGIETANGGLEEGAIKAYRAVCHAFPEVKSIGGRRYSSIVGNKSQHYTGEAIDIMINDSGKNDSALGAKIKDYLIEHGSEIDFYYVIWEQELTYGDGDGYMMGDRGNPTQNHMDHVHLSICAGKSDCRVTADGSGGSKGSGDSDEGSGGSSDQGNTDSSEGDEKGESVKGTEAQGVGPYKLDMKKVEELADDDEKDYPVITEEEAKDLQKSSQYVAKVLSMMLPPGTNQRLDAGTTHSSIGGDAKVRAAYQPNEEEAGSGSRHTVDEIEEAYVGALKKMPLGSAEQNAEPIFRLARLWAWGVPPSEADCSALPSSKNGSWKNPFIGDQTGPDFGEEFGDSGIDKVDGESDKHLGEDYILTDDGVIKAAAKGKVARATGSSVVIDHGNQVQSVTELMDEVEVEEGDELEPGDTIGKGGGGEPGGGGDPADNDSGDEGGSGGDDSGDGSDDSGDGDEGSGGENDPTRNEKDGKTAYIEKPVVDFGSGRMVVGGTDFAGSDKVEVTFNGGTPKTPSVGSDGSWKTDESALNHGKGGESVPVEVKVSVNGEEHSTFTITVKDGLSASNATAADGEKSEDHGVVHYQINDGKDAVNPSKFLLQRGVELGVGEQPGNGRDGGSGEDDDSGGGPDHDGGGPSDDPSKNKSADGMNVQIEELNAYAGESFKLSGSGFEPTGSPNVQSEFAAGVKKIDVDSKGNWSLEYPAQKADIDKGITTLTVKGYSAKEQAKERSFDFSVRVLDRNEDDAESETKKFGGGTVTLQQPIITRDGAWTLTGKGLEDLAGETVRLTVSGLPGDGMTGGGRDQTARVGKDGTFEKDYKPRRSDVGGDSGTMTVTVVGSSKEKTEFSPIGVVEKAVKGEAPQAGAEGVERTGTENSVGGAVASASSSTGDEKTDDTDFDSLGDELKSKKADGTEITIDKEGLKNASIIIGVAMNNGADTHGAITAITSSLVETGGTLHNYDHGPGSSLGLFQQKTKWGWGTAEELMDPEYAASAFIGGPKGPNNGDPPGLMDIDGWEDMSPDEGAAAVQGIDSTGRSMLAGYIPVAEDIVGQVDGTVTPDNCEDNSQGWNGERADKKEWGGHTNGNIPDNQLCEITVGSIGAPDPRMRCDAAEQYDKMAGAYEKDEGTEMHATSAYRSIAEQERVAAENPGKAAKPGTSTHGWALAVDISVGGQTNWSSPVYIWLKENAEEYGFEHPSWAEPGGSLPEAWHWEFFGKWSGDE